MPGSKTRNTKHMHIVLDRLLCCFCRSLEQGTDIHIETDICIACSYYLCTAIVAILAHLGDHDPWLAGFLSCEFSYKASCFIKIFVLLLLTRINSCNSTYHGFMPPKYFFTCKRNLSQAGP